MSALDWRQRDRRIAEREREFHAAGDYRERCEAQFHLVCTGCGVCACSNDDGDFLADWLHGPVRVSTDKDRDTLCQECRYDKNAPWNQ